jgi:hypothetical protein
MTRAFCLHALQHKGQQDCSALSLDIVFSSLQHASHFCTAVLAFTASADANGCIGNTCAQDPNSNGTCLDMPAPGTGYTCACKNGAPWNNGRCEGAWCFIKAIIPCC